MTMTIVPWTSPLRLKAYGSPSTPAPTTEMNRLEAALTDKAIGTCRQAVKLWLATTPLQVEYTCSCDSCCDLRMRQTVMPFIASWHLPSAEAGLSQHPALAASFPLVLQAFAGSPLSR